MYLLYKPLVKNLQRKHKLEAKAKTELSIGYSSQSKGYRIFNLQIEKVDITFDKMLLGIGKKMRKKDWRMSPHSNKIQDLINCQVKRLQFKKLATRPRTRTMKKSMRVLQVILNRHLHSLLHNLSYTTWLQRGSKDKSSHLKGMLIISFVIMLFMSPTMMMKWLIIKNGGLQWRRYTWLRKIKHGI